MTATVFEAKTNLSELIKRAQAGEKVVITMGRSKTPIAEIAPIARKEFKRLGALETIGFELGTAFDEPLPAEWSGELSDDLSA